MPLTIPLKQASDVDLSTRFGIWEFILYINKHYKISNISNIAYSNKEKRVDTPIFDSSRSRFFYPLK